jgi:hypothetical protein
MRAGDEGEVRSPVRVNQECDLSMLGGPSGVPIAFRHGGIRDEDSEDKEGEQEDALHGSPR